jgi:aminopeptidase N
MGLFALDYDSASGPQRALFTQFEVGDARRMVPCWDEPARKATFTVTVLAPAAQLVVSNMPAAQTEIAADGRQRVRFQTTPKMSSYLLFLALGDFERVHRQVGPVDVGVVVKRGGATQAGFALDAAAQLLPYYNEYFGMPYPLPKLDLVAAPGTSLLTAAMENWGAILFFEKVVLLDPRISTEGDRRSVYIDVAHELAHQWFGDLVTMAWWDDLWLNEGFAAWMETRSTDHFHPEWKVWAKAMGATQQAMRLDAAVGTHPVVAPIADVLEANEAFDDITYEKGAAVVRMLESHAGVAKFRDGVRRYLRAYAYGNSVSDDLWRAIEGPGARTLAGIAHEFTLQEGVPLVRVSNRGCHAGRELLSLSQARFALDESGRHGAQRWHVPLALRSVAGGVAREVIVAGARPQPVSMPGCGPVVANAGQSSYLRAQYLGSAFAAMADHFRQLEVADQLGLLHDTAALAFAGRMPLSDFLTLAGRLPIDADPLVWRAAIDRLVVLDYAYEGLPTQSGFRDYARRLLAPLLARLGWEPATGEEGNVALERRELLSALGRFADPAVLAAARQRFAAYRQDPNALGPALRGSMLDVMAGNADAVEWEQLRSLAQAAPTALEKQELYRRLGQARDPVLAQRALDLALSGEVPETSRSQILAAVAAEHPDLTVKFLTAHWAAVEPVIEAPARAQFVANAAASGNDPAIIAVLEAHAARFPPASAGAALRRNSARVRYNAQLRARLAEIDRWIAPQS